VTFGTACGLVAVMVNPGSGPHGMTLAAAGLLGSTYARFGRVAGALLTCGLSLLFHAAGGEGEALLLGVYEALVAGLLLLILPAGWEDKTRRWLCRREEHSAVAAWQLHWHNRLELAAHTLSEMAHTVEQVSEKLTGLSGPGLSDVYAGLGDTVCRHCPRKMVCWTSRYDETMDALNHLTPLLREEGRVTETALLPGFAVCPRRDLLAERLSADFAAYRARETAFTRLAELRRGVTGQFEEVSGLLAEWARRAAEPVTVEIAPARRIREVCAGLGLGEAEITCRRLKNQGLAVQLWLPDGPTLPAEELRREIGDACGQEFGPPVVCRTAGLWRVSLCPPPRFRVCIGTAQLCCDGQTLCGDAVEQLADESGQVTAILSDGMGSGGRAAVDGTMCAALTARLLAAGFGADSTLQLVNTALMVRAGEESLATLDMLTVDVYTGDLVCRKAGAAASLLKSGDRISRIEQTSLPVGILKEVRFAEYRDRLVAGDTVLLCSDGVYLGGSGWVEELMKAAPASKPPRELARAVVEEARRRAPAGREDDTTAVVVRLERCDK
ncbi:MAG: SpoIIE family protein phosphatase, partial [Clostridia bacterium]|nr:SpoIIE family protein phosphatase [Clostridia bacterium]